MVILDHFLYKARLQTGVGWVGDGAVHPVDSLTLGERQRCWLRASNGGPVVFSPGAIKMDGSNGVMGHLHLQMGFDKKWMILTVTCLF